ncbi:type VI secretion system protein TssL, long form [Shewanella litoralis]|uniref:Flagellar motor protein n=1 Tax=Shewanella litoralis TaxID=2282700 RepID=A0ABQ2R8K2_9GAMM|nr:type VI secretion system protein TssL, long form [Shewanella litoralis]GGQ19309.1 flagellar motor protein [Shewanella litoralis]
MNDKTIVKPRPGKGAGMAGTKTKVDDDNQKTLIQDQRVDNRANRSQLSLSQNPIVDYAGTLLSICTQLRNSTQHDDVNTLRVHCVELIKNYEQQLRNSDLASDDIKSARYCLCCFIDEVVLNTPWGEQSYWASDSLLSTFHNETLGGEYFYTLLDASLRNPAEKCNLLELMYLCLTLGFVGKMRIEPQGDQKLEALRERTYLAIQSCKGDFHRELSPGWRQNIVPNLTFQQPFPLWVIGTLFGVVILFIYMWFSYSINHYSSETYKELTSIVPWDKTVEAQQQLSREEALLLQQLLQTEIGKNLLEVEQLSDRVRIRIGATELFASGNTQPRSDFEAILAKIARTLESTDGKILITGHTDDEPIFTSKYPSNWHLSLARATSIANVLANNASLSGRLWPEGRGESEPRVPNDSDLNRGLNRRIEIDLLF